MITVPELLLQHNIVFQESGQSISVRCLNPEHEDNNPSMRINSTTGDAHCFSCGHSTNVYKHFGVELNKVNTKVFRLLGKLDARRNPVIELPEGNIAITQPYRGISVETLKHFGAFTNMLYFPDKLCIPVKGFDNKTKCILTRDIYSDVSRYMIFPKGARPVVMPTRPTISNKTLIVVEGIFDMLKAYDAGMRNVICTFGTSSALVRSTMEAIASISNLLGATRVILALDNDKAGRATTDTLMAFLINLVPSVEQFDWETLESLLGKPIKDFGELEKDDFLYFQHLIHNKAKNSP